MFLSQKQNPHILYRTHGFICLEIGIKKRDAFCNTSPFKKIPENFVRS